MNIIRIVLVLLWIFDITNMPFMEMFDTTYPINALVWLLIWIFVIGIKIKVKYEWNTCFLRSEYDYRSWN